LTEIKIPAEAFNTNFARKKSMVNSYNTFRNAERRDKTNHLKKNFFFEERLDKYTYLTYYKLVMENKNNEI
jgi:hypothetical protein